MLQYAQPAIELLKRDYSKHSEPNRLTMLTKLNVLEQMAHLHSHPAIEEGFELGPLDIHGWFYEIHTGTVEVFDPKRGRFERWPEGD
jgi:carbonic anhydrase